MQSRPPGSMMAVSLKEDELQPYLSDEVQLAVCNAPNRNVLAGPSQALERVAAQLKENGKNGTLLHTSHAFHSAMMDGVLDRFLREVRKVTLKAPRIPYVSNVTGTWITDTQAMDPEYYTRHLRGTVRFAQGLQTLFEKGPQIFIESGPGKTLMTFAKQQSGRESANLALSTIRAPKATDPDTRFFAATLAQLWVAGVPVDWAAYHADVARLRVPLPTYPFARVRHWVDPVPMVAQAAPAVVASEPPVVVSVRTQVKRKEDTSEWFYQPLWKQTPAAPLFEFHKMTRSQDTWLVFLDYCGLGAQLVERLYQAGQKVITVKTGEWYAKRSDGGYTINPGRRSDYEALFEDLSLVGQIPKRVVHLWNVTAERKFQSRDAHVSLCTERGFISLVFLAQAYESLGHSDMLHVGVLSNNMQEVTDGDLTMPEKATLLGACKVIPREYPHMDVRSIDVVIPAHEKTRLLLVDQLLGELAVTSSDTVIAYRGRRRWLQTFEPVPLGPVMPQADRLRKGGVYVITGGLGGLGKALSLHLAEAFGAKLALISRTPVPAHRDWDQWLQRHHDKDPTSQNILHLRRLERAGARVLALSADVTQLEAMRAAVSKIEREFGRVNGVIHAAGVAPSGPVRNLTREKCETVLAPKVTGTLVLDELFRDHELDFMLLLSSTSSILGHYGNADYCAGNTFLDAFAHYHNAHGRFNTIAVNSDAWREVGMASVEEISEREQRRLQVDMMLTNEEGIEGIRRILSGDMYSQIVLSPRDLIAELDKVHAFEVQHLEEETRNEVLLPAQPLPVATPPTPRVEEPRDVSSPEPGPGVAAAPKPDVAPVLQVPFAEQSDTLEKVKELWEESLGVPDIGPHDDFTDLGGDSLLATMVASRMRRVFKVAVSPSLFNEEPTITGMARAIDKLLGTDSGHTRGARASTPEDVPPMSEPERMLCVLASSAFGAPMTLDASLAEQLSDPGEAERFARDVSDAFDIQLAPTALHGLANLKAVLDHIETIQWAAGTPTDAVDAEDDEEFEI